MEERNYEVEINATKNQVEDFKESVLWQDICRELDFWAEGLEVENELLPDEIVKKNLSTAAALTLFISIEERKAAVKYFKQIPEVFLQILEEKANDSGRNTTD